MAVGSYVDVGRKADVSLRDHSGRTVVPLTFIEKRWETHFGGKSLG